MKETLNKVTAFLKLIAAFVIGFLLWNYALFPLEWLAHSYHIDSSWTVVLSRFALFGYFVPFIVWYYVEPQTVCDFRLGRVRASIKMPFIWYGIKDNVLRVSLGFSLSCVLLAGTLFYSKQLSPSILLAGFSFSLINSFLEEFLWRGLILSRSIDLWGEKLGLILMSLAFGFYHYPLEFSMPVCLLFSLGGVYFGGIAIRSNGLLLGTVMHGSMNLLFVAMGIIF